MELEIENSAEIAANTIEPIEKSRVTALLI